MASQIETVPLNKVYHGGPSNEAFRYVYLYYLKPWETHENRVEVYFIDLKQDKTLTQADVINLIVEVENHEHPKITNHIIDLAWRHKGYLIFATRHAQYRFKEEDAVVFDYAHWVYRGNHSFRHGKDILNAGEVSGIWCVNIRKRHGGTDLGNKKEEFNIYFPDIPHFSYTKVGLVISTLKMLLGILSHNEVGSNTGP
jgi:hypothetical protein